VTERRRVETVSLVDNEHTKEVQVKLGIELFFMIPSEKDGHFMGIIRIPRRQAEVDVRHS